MGSIFSDIFNIIGSVPRAIGEWTANAGIPNEFATAYMQNLDAQAKKQFYTENLKKAMLENADLENKAALYKIMNPSSTTDNMQFDSTNQVVPNQNFNQAKAKAYNQGLDNQNFQNQITNVFDPTKSASDNLGSFGTPGADGSPAFSGNTGARQSNMSQMFASQTGYTPKVSNNWTNVPLQQAPVQQQAPASVPVTQAAPAVATPTQQTTTTPYGYKDVSNFLGDGQSADFSGLTPRTAKAGSLLLDNLKGDGHDVWINSAYRDEARNTAAGGVPNSNHLSGTAFDVGYKTDDDRQAIMKQAEASGWRVYPEGDHIHIDTFQGTLPDDPQTTETPAVQAPATPPFATNGTFQGGTAQPVTDEKSSISNIMNTYTNSINSGTDQKVAQGNLISQIMNNPYSNSPSFKNDATYLANYANVPANIMSQIFKPQNQASVLGSNAFSNVMSSLPPADVLPNTVHNALNQQEMALKYPYQFLNQKEMTPEKYNLLTMDPSTRILAAQIHNGLALSSEQTLKGNQTATEQRQKTYDNVMHQGFASYKTFNESGGSVEEANNIIRTMRDEYSNAGINPDSLHISLVPQEGTNNVRLRLDTAKTLSDIDKNANQMKNNDKRTEMEGQKLNIAQTLASAKLQAIGLELQEKTKSLNGEDSTGWAKSEHLEKIRQQFQTAADTPMTHEAYAQTIQNIIDTNKPWAESNGSYGFLQRTADAALPNGNTNGVTAGQPYNPPLNP